MSYSNGNGRPRAMTEEVMRDMAILTGNDWGEQPADYGLDAATAPVSGGANEGAKPIPSGTPTNGALEPNLRGARTSGPLMAPKGSGTPTPRLYRCDIGRMLATEPEPIDWLATGIIARGFLTLFVGREKTGKSLLALAISSRCAEGGGTVAGIDCAGARVLYVDCENGGREIHRRVRGLGLSTATGLVMYEGVGFDLLSGLDELDAVLTAEKPDLVWLDSWRSMWGGDENSAQEASQVLDPLCALIRSHNVGAGLLHHANKLGQYRGSTAVGASVGNLVELAKVEDDDDRRRRRLRSTGCRFDEDADDRWLRIEADRARGLVLIDEAQPFVRSQGGRPPEKREEAEGALLAALGDTFIPWPDWARAAGLDPKNGTARRACEALADRRLVTCAQGMWRKGNPTDDNDTNQETNR